MIKAVIFDMYETLVTHYECPLYFSADMAQDVGISTERFRELWRPTDHARTVGEMTLEQAIEDILKETGRYRPELLDLIVSKRKATKVEVFRHLNPEIIPMLERLKAKGIRIGLISNCFGEEVTAIRNSELFPYFDVPCMSYELGMKKPDHRIFHHCTDRLSVKPEECLYVGDGGSDELETATELGMKAVQALWYMKEGTSSPVHRKEGFLQAECPLEILALV